MTWLQDTLGEVGELAGQALRGGLKVSVKTNLGPELAVSGQGRGLAEALGIKAAVIVRDRDGRQLVTYGTPPATEPLRVALLAIIAGALGWLFIRGVLRR